MVEILNGWELTQHENGSVIISVDGIKAGETENEAEAREFCLINDPLPVENQPWEVCLNVSPSRRKTDCCPSCSQAQKLGKMLLCKMERYE